MGNLSYFTKLKKKSAIWGKFSPEISSTPNQPFAAALLVSLSAACQGR